MLRRDPAALSQGRQVKLSVGIWREARNRTAASFLLGLTVANMRANPNTRPTHECEIVDGHGLRGRPRQIPSPSVHPFSYYQNLISRAPVRRVDRDAG